MQARLSKTLQVIRTCTTQAQTKATAPASQLSSFARFRERAKGTRFENWVRFWENVFIDYREVVKDVATGAREKPLKALAYLTGFGAITYVAQNRPDERDFMDAFIKSYTDLLLVHPSQQRTDSVQHLKMIERLHNAKLLRFQNAGLLTVVWSDEFSADCRTYESICPHLQMQYKSLRDRLVDIGILNHWCVLSDKMDNYDVNI